MKAILSSMAVLVALVATVVPAYVAESGEAAAAKRPPKEESGDMAAEARAFLKTYQKDLAKLEVPASLAFWKAAQTGSKEDFAAAAEASLAVRKFHSDPEAYRRVKRLVEAKPKLTPVEARALQVAELAYRANQLPEDLLKQMVELSSEIERSLSTYRAEVGGKRFSNNDLLEMLGKENDSARREEIWKALKQVGGVVAPRLVELAKLRNQAAKKLGFANYWAMQIRLQEHDPKQLVALFDELERLTREPFEEMKAEMDAELAKRFGVPAGQLMPWHYDNPFFQAAPPSDAVDLDQFYEDKTKEQIVEIARRYYAALGLPVEGILERSDLYEREGKDQHAFCTSIDRADDVRILCNVKPTFDWMDTTMHELGHAVYDLGIDRRLPYNLREPAQAFTTEGVAMLFGAQASNPDWMIRWAGADEAQVRKLAGAIREQRRREQLIFARWTLVMLHFEKALYEDPERDLNTLWWDYVERYQMLKRPPDRDVPDWAAKPHFTSAPVYYHSYMLGELFAAQVRHAFAERFDSGGSDAEVPTDRQEALGQFLKQRVFRPGDRLPWPAFVRHATGEPLTPRYFAAEVKGKK